jgi:hypothetical protein
MVSITITQAAYDAIASTLLVGSVAVEVRRSESEVRIPRKST